MIVVAIAGDYGKPRPSLAIQSDLFADLPSRTVCPIKSTIREDASLIRLTIEPSRRNGLALTSQVLIDKITTVRLAKVGKVVGQVEPEFMVRGNRMVALFLGIV